MTRWQSKASALSTAFKARYAVDLTTKGVTLGLCPAQLETKCGDAWPGPDGLVDTADDERNWGACTLRSLNAAEAAAVKAAGLYPTVGAGHNEVAAKAMAALAAAGIPRASGTVAGIPVPSATIHCDSRTVKDPITGKPRLIPHFVWFANFATHEDGAAYYLHLLGASARSVLIRGGTAHELAAAMYARGYYGGFHPHGTYIGKDGKEHDGNAENIGAYEGLIAYWLPKISAALDPTAPAVRPTLRRGAHGDLVEELQAAMNAKDGHPTLLEVDGIFGALTEDAVEAFQRTHPPLGVDGIVGPKTWAALGFK